MRGQLRGRLLVAALAALLVIPFAPTSTALAAEPTTTAVSSSLNPSIYGESVTFTATVNPPTATGSVQFVVDGADLGTPVTIAGGTATSDALSTLTAGTHTVTANFTSDDPVNFTDSPGTLAGGQVVDPATLVVTPSAQSVLYGSAAPVHTFTVTGFVLSEDETTATGYAASTCTSDFTSATSVSASPRTISCSGGSASNYTFDDTATAQLIITAANQTITFGDLPDTTFDQSPITVSASATSGLAVAFSSLTPSVCTVAGTTVTFVAVGTCTVRAAQAGNANWNLASNVDRTFTVTRAAQATLTVNASSPATYGTTQPLTTSGGSGSGAVTYGVGASTACSVTGDQLTITAGTGTCAVTATKATDANYNVQTSAPEPVTVAKAGQAITFTSTAPSAAAVGGTTYTPIAAATSGLAVTFSIEPASSSVCAIAAGVVSFVAIGTCTIDADQAGDANWNAALRQQQSFGVGLGTTTTGVVSSASPSTYGGSVTFTASVANADWTATGTVTFKDGAATLGAGILSGGVAAFTTSALVAGDHAITAVYGGDGHLAQSTSGALTQTVAKASLTVTADPASRPYGAANPAFTATTSGLVNGDTAAVVTGSPPCTTPATVTDPVGAYAITCDVTGMSAADYTFTPVAGTLTITPAASAIDLAGLPAGGVGVYEAKVPAAFTATFGPTVGSAVPAGMATFLVDGVARPPVAIVGGVATLPNVMFVTTGTHQVAVRYAGDGGNFGPAPDSALAVPVVANTVRASSVGVSGTTIYPYRDTWRDTVSVRGTRAEPLSVSITIYSPTGSRVRTKTFVRASGAYAYAWNGRTSSGTILAAGKYKVVQVLADAYGARRTYTSYVTLSRKRMYWYTKTLTVLSGPRNYQMRSTTNTSVLSAPSSTISRALGMVNATDSPTWIAVGYQFSLPSASTYRSLSFQVRGSWTGATAPKIGLIPWNGGSWGSIYSLTRARATMGTSTSAYYSQTLTSLRGIVSGRSVRASIDSFAAPSGYGPGPFRYSITAVRLVVRYGILR